MFATAADIQRELVLPLAPLVAELHALTAANDTSPRLVDAVFELRRLTAKLIEPRYRKSDVDIYLPLKTVCEVNGARRAHWRVQHKRGKEQIHAVYLSLLAPLRRLGRVPVPSTVYLTRISPMSLDLGDNYPSAFKYVRDAIATALGVDDADPRVEWQYLPGYKGKPKEYAVHIQIIDRGRAPQNEDAHGTVPIDAGPPGEAPLVLQRRGGRSRLALK
jgi:hypothetical protein